MKFVYWAKKNYLVILTVLVLIMGIFFRTYNFSDWLHFELDQSRDAKVIHLAVEDGIGNLPLLGPRAGGTFLRLGPAFYYMEYVSALVFGNTPVGMAVVVLIFAILSLPLFYFFCRSYFSQKISLLLLMVFSMSFYLIIYSRFAWNPNPLPFFTLLIFIALLKMTDVQEKRKDIWFYVFSFSLAIIWQLHFLAMIAMSIFSAIFFVLTRPKFSIRAWAVAAAIFLSLMSPMIINDIKTGGDNVNEFFKAITEKSDKRDNYLIKKIYRDFSEHSAKYALILTGKEELYLVNMKFRGDKWYRPNFVCEKDCPSNIYIEFAGMVFFATGSLLLIWKLMKEKDEKRKRFLYIITAYLGTTFVMFIPLALYLSPRFFIVSAIIPFVFLGLILEFIDEKIRYKNWLLALIVVVIIALNLHFITDQFRKFAEAPYKAEEINTDLLIDEDAVFTYEQQKIICDYIKSFYDQNGYPVYIDSNPRYERSLLYHFSRQGIPESVLTYEEDNIYRNGNYFLIYVTLSNMETDLNRYRDKFDIGESKNFGSLTLSHAYPKETAITAEQEIFLDKKETKNRKSLRRYKWNEVFVDDGSRQILEEDDELQNQDNNQDD